MNDPDFSNIRVLIFDFDDTLYHTNLWLVDLIRPWLKDAGLEEQAGLSNEAIQDGFRVARDWLWKYMKSTNLQPTWIPPEEMWLRYTEVLLGTLGVVKEIREHAIDLTRTWLEYGYDFKTKFIEESRPVLEELRSRGYRFGLVTNRWEDPTPMLERDSIIHLFDDVQHSHVPGYMKPSPYMLLQVASRLGVNPLRCAFIGDFVALDVEAAIRASMMPILLTWRRPDEKEKAPPDAIIIDHINELLKLFQPVLSS
ncbi:MAG: HAD family hydrolase [Candidatus Hodarchaeota archaeon]